MSGGNVLYQEKGTCNLGTGEAVRDKGNWKDISDWGGTFPGEFRYDFRGKRKKTPKKRRKRALEKKKKKDRPAEKLTTIPR